jgi:shikimate kinase
VGSFKGGNIVLIGPRACGKSTVGRLLAERLGFDFVDTDEEVERRTGLEIAQIVQLYGWERFREEEKEVIKEIMKRESQVIATGGGVVLDEENVKLLKENGIVFLLWLEPEKIVERLKKDPQFEKRPPLKGDLLGEVREVVEERKSLYFSAAHFVLDASKGVMEVVEEILKVMGLRDEQLR